MASGIRVQAGMITLIKGTDCEERMTNDALLLKISIESDLLWFAYANHPLSMELRGHEVRLEILQESQSSCGVYALYNSFRGSEYSARNVQK